LLSKLQKLHIQIIAKISGKILFSSSSESNDFDLKNTCGDGMNIFGKQFNQQALQKVNINSSAKKRAFYIGAQTTVLLFDNLALLLTSKFVHNVVSWQFDIGKACCFNR